MAQSGEPIRASNGIDTSVRIGSIELSAPVMTASGTAGYGTEFAGFFDLGELGAVVTKSIAAFEWAGNPAPRVYGLPQAMLNAVGLQGPGIESWLAEQLPRLIATGATVVCSIWGRSVDEYRAAAEMLADAPPQVVAVEVNLSCPNLSGHGIFAHDPALSAAVIDATAPCRRPRWAKLSANTDRTAEVARAAVDAGAESLTLINTLLGMAIDPVTLQPTLGNGGGGLSGRAIHPVAVRTVYEVRRALPDIPIVGVGGVTSGWEGIEMLIAGADAVQVGTASFADPRAPARVQLAMVDWLAEHGLASFSAIPRLP